MIEIAEKPNQLSNAASHILRVDVRADNPVRVRRSKVLAAVGEVDFWHEEAITGNNRSPEDASSDSLVRVGVGGRLKKRTRAGFSIARSSAGTMRLHQATGDGELYMGSNGGDVTVYQVTDEDLVVFDQADVLAYSDTLTADTRTEVGRQLAAVLNSVHAWVLSGTGEVATATSGEVIVIQVTPERPVRVEAEGLLARTQGVALATAAQYKRKIISRKVSGAMRLVPGVVIPRTRVFLTATGRGQVVVRSSD